MEEIYLCIDKYGSQTIKKCSIDDYFVNYDDDIVMIKLDKEVVAELKGDD